MKIRTIVLMMVLLCMFGLAASFAAENPNMGTWKLNEAKSTFTPEATKNTTVVSLPAEIVPTVRHPDHTPVLCGLCPYTSPSLLGFLMHMNHQHPDWTREFWLRTETA